MTRSDDLRDTLTRERERLRELLDSSPVGHFVTDRYGRIVQANGPAERLLGGDGRTIVGRLLPSFVPRAERLELRAAINHAAEGKTRRPVVGVAGDGDTALQLAATPVVSDPDRIRWVVRDITAQRDAEERITRLRRRVAELRAAGLDPGVPDAQANENVIVSFALLASERDQLRALLDRLEQGIVAIDRHLVVEVANDAAGALLGDRLVEGERLPEPWPEQVSLKELVGSLFRRGALGAETRVSLPDGVAYAIEGLPAGSLARNAVLLITDVTKRERAERVEREFVANASHELRTPLATISGAVEILQSGAKDNPAARDRFLGHIQREVDRLSRLVRALLVLARAQAKSEAPRLAPVPLRPLLEEVAELITVQPNVEVVVVCPPDAAAHADGDLLLEIVANLASNAASHTTEGRITLAAVRRGRSVVIEVRDTGSGIAAADQAHLFERFYRPGGRDSRRFGLGLAIVHDAVTAVGGEIELESQAGRGTTVRVKLPQAEAVA